MSRKLQRMYSEAGLPELDEETAIYLEQALEDERVPRPEAAETLHLKAVLSERLAVQTKQSSYRQLVDKERAKAAGSWPKVLTGLYQIMQLVGPQVRLITGAFWLSSAVVMSLGVMLLPVQMRLTALLLASPLLAGASVAYAFRSYSHGVVEWERSCPVTPGDLVLARLLLVVLYDILLSSLVSVALYATGVGEPSAIIILAWLAPLLALAGVTLLISLRYGHLPAVVSGSLLWLAFALLSREKLLFLSGPAISIIWCMLAIAGVGCMVAAAVHTSRWEITYVD